MTGFDRLRERYDRGSRLVEGQDFRAAEKVLAALADELDRPGLDRATTRLRVRVLTALYSSRRELGDVDEGRGLAAKAFELAERAGFHDLQVALLSALAYNQSRAGHPQEALATLERGEPLLADCPTQDRVRFLLNRGFVRLEQGELDDAGRDLRRAEQEGVGAELHELAQKARHNRGYLAFLSGDLPRALDHFATAVVEPGDAPGVHDVMVDPIARMDRARVLQEAGLVEAADDLLAESLAALRGSGRGQDEGEAHLARARGALIGGDLVLAAEQTDLAAARFSERGNDRWSRRATFVRLAVRLEQLQERVEATGDSALGVDAEELADEMERLARSASAHADDEIALPARFMVAEAALLVPDLDRAAVVLAGADVEHAPVSVRLRWHRARAGLADAARGDEVQAIVRDGLAELSRAQSRLGSVDLRTAMAIHGRELAALGVADALRSGDPACIHEAVERSHASSTRLAPVRAWASDEELHQLARLRRANDLLRNVDPDEQPDRAKSLRAEIADLQRALRQQEWQRAGTHGDADVVTLGEVRRLLRPLGGVVASFTSVGPELYAVRIDPHDVAVIPLGPLAPVVELVERLRSDLQAVVLPGVPSAVRAVMQRSVRATLDRLNARLVQPLEMAGAPLVVVPHDRLSLVPWSLLRDRLGLPVTTVPSLTRWTRATSPLARPTPGPGLDPGSAAVSEDVVALAGPDLTRGESEVLAVAGTWPHAHVLRGTAATGAAVRRALRAARVVHLAAHGSHQMSSPLFSSLRMADGPMFAHELEPDPLARLVVLSSCEVGSHTIRRGDEPLGLTAALLQAGVPTVVAGLARVEDQAAHDVMIDMHRAIAQGRSPAAALGEAVATAFEGGRLVPFTCVGAGLSPLG